MGKGTVIILSICIQSQKMSFQKYKNREHFISCTESSSPYLIDNTRSDFIHSNSHLLASLIFKMFLQLSFLLAPLLLVSGEKIQSIATHTGSCLTCGMIEGTSYLTVQVCGSTDCCLSRSLDSDGINWLPGQTDTFQGE